ncbi:MAG: hypothetical protein HONDAALG_03091 [Gammaproteobacteria bacterium]|nr:hypothetical protein [Gammaproteobacteria bacterium]
MPLDNPIESRFKQPLIQRPLNQHDALRIIWRRLIALLQQPQARLLRRQPESFDIFFSRFNA